MDKDKKSQQKIKDDALWAYAIQDVIPLKSSEYKEKISLKKKADINNISKSLKSNATAASSEKDNPIRGREIDNATRRRFDRGQIPIEAKLDMHGMSQIQAYDALMDFITHSRRERRRCILVITGKGGRYSDDSGHGILKRKTPQWLEDETVRPHILSFRYAKPKDGGDGAIYILLRRK